LLLRDGAAFDPTPAVHGNVLSASVRAFRKPIKY
jgi:hypothetical protein